MNSLPKYLYHATYKPYLKSILENGLGGKIKRKNWSFSADGITYLSDDEEVAFSYAEISESLEDYCDEHDCYEKYFDNIIVIKIDTNRLDTDKLFVDRNNQDGDTYEYHGIIYKEAFAEIINR